MLWMIHIACLLGTNTVIELRLDMLQTLPDTVLTMFGPSHLLQLLVIIQTWGPDALGANGSPARPIFLMFVPLDGPIRIE